ncbi:MAG: hypothetical protein N4A71_03720 [Carboxylicivirga sp.]|nr:hypothetical protein [Carboxylicivirga sp.]
MNVIAILWLLPLVNCTSIKHTDSVEEPEKIVIPYDRSLNEITLLGTHNSYALKGRIAFANQCLDLPSQIKYGIRSIELDFWKRWYVGFIITHDARYNPFYYKALDYLKGIKKMLDDQPELFLRVHPDIHISDAELEQLMDDAGLLPYCYKHIPSTAWPTLSELAKLNKRFWITGGPATYWTSSSSDLMVIPGRTGMDELSLDISGSLEADIFEIRAYATNKLEYGSEKHSKQINDFHFIRNMTFNAWKKVGRQPNIIAVDYFREEDGLIKVANYLNACHRIEVLVKDKEGNIVPRVQWENRYSVSDAYEIPFPSSGIVGSETHGKGCFPAISGERITVKPVKEGFKFTPELVTIKQAEKNRQLVFVME